MIPVRIFAVLFLLGTVNAFGQFSSGPPSIDPPDPTSMDDVTLFVQQVDSCPPIPTVTRSGFDISVIVHYGLCLFPPTLITHSLDLGRLPAGRYSVTITYTGSSTPVMFSFVVLDANSTVAVS